MIDPERFRRLGHGSSFHLDHGSAEGQEAFPLPLRVDELVPTEDGPEPHMRSSPASTSLLAQRREHEVIETIADPVQEGR